MTCTGLLNRKQRRGGKEITPRQEDQEKATIRDYVPSEPWVEAHFEEKIHAGRVVRFRLPDNKVFPPGNKETSMLRCVICDRIVPPDSIEVWSIPHVTLITLKRVERRRAALGLTVGQVIARIGLNGIDEWNSIFRRRHSTSNEEIRDEFAEVLKCEPRYLTTVTYSHYAGCMDHKPQELHAAHGASPSATAIATLQYRNLRLDLTKLPSEQTSDLKREIRRYEKTGIVRGK
jgi:hypothetical protein